MFVFDFKEWGAKLCALMLMFLFASNLSGQVDLVLPHNNYTFLADSVSFEWNETGNEDYFELQLDNTNAFLTPTAYIVYGSDTVINSLIVGQYYWRVRSFASGQPSAWSTVRGFRRINLSDFGTLGLWTNANDLTPLGNGAVIDGWNDNSSNNYNLIQTTESFKPILITNSLNGNSALDFDGTTQLSNSTANTIATHFAFFYRSVAGNSIISALTTASTNPRFFNVILSSQISTGFSTTFPAGSVWKNLTTNLSSPVNTYNLTAGVRTTPLAITSFALSPLHTSSYVRLTGRIYEIIFYQTTLSNSDIDAVEDYMRFKYSPPVSLGKDITIEHGFCDTTLAAKTTFQTYLWSNGQTTPTIAVNQSGTYWLQATDVLGLVSRDTVVVTYPQIQNPNSTLFCSGDSVNWNPGLGNVYTYSWSNTESPDSLWIDVAGDYFVVISDTLGCQRTSSTFNFEEDTYPLSMSLGSDTSLCAGNPIQLEVGAPETNSYLWNDMSTQPSVNVLSSGTYYVEGLNSNGCVGYDTIFVTVNGQAPTVSFSAPPECSNIATQFTDLSSNIASDPIVSWFWDLGDGTFSNDQNHSHLYLDSGLYSVQLTVESQGGCSSSLAQDVVVRKIPSANFTSTGQCSVQQISFSNGSSLGTGNQLSFEWDFGDGGPGNNSTLINPDYSYTNAGAYNVTLIATDDLGCSDTVVQLITILQSPLASFNITNTCENSPFQCVNTSIVEPFSTYLWNFDDNTSSILESPIKVFTTSGEHVIQLTVSGQNGCIYTLIDTIFVNPNPIANYELGPICFGTFSTINATSTIPIGSIASNSWVINGGIPSVGNSISHFVDQMGQNQIILTSTSAEGCVNTVNQFFDVTEVFNAAFTTDASVVSQGDEIEFSNLSGSGSTALWSFGDGTTSSDFSPIHTYGEEFVDSLLNVVLVAVNASGCIDTATSQIEIRFPQLDLALEELYVQNQGQNYVIGAKMKNNGSKRIERIDFQLSSHEGALFDEVWNGVLLPDESFVYLFSGMPHIQYSSEDGIESFVCVNSFGYDANLQAELNLSNNRACKNIEGSGVVLMPIFPNPISESAMIEFFVSEKASVEIDLVDLNGKLVSVIQKLNEFDPGIHSLQWDSKFLQAGSYYLRLIADDQVILKQISIF